MLPPEINLKYPVIIYETFSEIETVLKEFLEKVSLKELFEQLAFAIKELSTNANKANLKRVYFLINKQDINNFQIYTQMMESFRSELQDKSDFYFKEAEKRGFFIQINLSADAKYFHLKISNNSPILAHEQERINKILDNYSRFKDMADVFAQEIDLSEGAGLGLYSLLMMLKNSGLKGNFFTLRSEGEYTTAEIEIPLDLKTEEAQAL